MENATPDLNRPAPARVQERIASLDFIRGLAVMGILAANIVAFGQPFSAYMMPSQFLTEHGPTSDWLWVAQFILIDGKMRGLFTLLFGAGLYLFMERAWERGSTRWLQVRRLLFLGAFGLIHFFFIWKGDILFGYAVLGLVALLLLKLKAKTQLIVGLAGYVLGAVFYAGVMGPLPFVADTPLGEQSQFSEMRAELEAGKAQDLADNALEAQIKTDGTYPEFVQHSLTQHTEQPIIGVALFGWETLPLMVIGIALYRFGLFSGGIHPGTQRMWGWIGIAVGGLMTLGIALWAKAGGYTYYGTLASFIAFTMIPRFLMTLGLAALLSLYAPRATGWLGERISAAGRAAFTNYLGTSIVMLFVFHGWALGLFGLLNRPQLYLVVLLAWALMLAWSKPWLQRFRYGPLEWLWRCLTYGKLFPMKR